MQEFYSTRNPSLRVSLREAVLQGLPEDNGLYMPVEIPRLPDTFFEQLNSFSFAELSFEVSKHFLQGAIPDRALRQIVEESITFDAPLVPVTEDISVLELFHGPTLAFKDFGARFMAQLMAYFVQDDPEELFILVATSGDTGGAVASGFYQTPGIRVIILYPSGKVSLLQEKQLTTLGHNITALEIDGTFDDCQALVKQAFLDSEVRRHLRLTSANSINISRLLPQMFYYFRAWQQVRDKSRPVVCCVPSGNFGNLTAGLMAMRMGLPMTGFIAATNINDVVPEYLDSGIYHPRPSVSTISNAMDVGRPSNFARMMDLYGEDRQTLMQDISGKSYTDEETKACISRVKERHGYLLDPHGAVGYLAMEEYLEQHPETLGIVLETAHPAKFLDVVESVTHAPVPVPERLERLAQLPKEAHFLSKEFGGFKDFLLGL